MITITFSILYWHIYIVDENNQEIDIIVTN